jgi:hypothetical protein
MYDIYIYTRRGGLMEALGGGSTLDIHIISSTYMGKSFLIPQYINPCTDDIDKDLTEEFM